jgi:hypothetical protein
MWEGEDDVPETLCVSGDTKNAMQITYKDGILEDNKGGGDTTCNHQ